MKKIVFTLVALCISTLSLASADRSAAFKGCIYDSKVVKLRENGSRIAEIVGLKCENGAAEYLFDNLKPFAKDEKAVWHGGEEIISRLVSGANGPGSLKCYKNVRKAYSWCIIMFDVRSDFVRSLSL